MNPVRLDLDAVRAILDSLPWLAAFGRGAESITLIRHADHILDGAAVAIGFYIGPRLTGGALS